MRLEAEHQFGRWRRACAGRILVVLLGVFSGVFPTQTGCEQSPSREEIARVRGKYRITFVGPAAGHPAARYYHGGVVALVKVVPSIEVSFVDPLDDSGVSIRESVAAALDGKPDGLVCYTASPETAEIAVNAAKFATVPIATFGPIETSDARCGHVHIDYPAAAELMGKSLQQIAQGGRSYILIHRQSTGGVAERMYQRFVVEADRSSLRLLDSVDIKGLSGLAARGSVDQLLEQYPYTSLIVSLDPAVWIEGPWRALPTGCAVASIGAYPELWAHLKDGSVKALAGHLDGQAATDACKLAYEWLLGGRREPHPRVIDAKLVTPEALEQFEQEYKAAAGM